MDSLRDVVHDHVNDDDVLFWVILRSDLINFGNFSYYI